MFLQGTKTIAYEIWEGLGFSAPDNVVLVAGAGSEILGCDLAFSELLAAGQIDRLPRLLVGQPEHWATIVDTFNGIDPASRGPRVATIAEGASIATPCGCRRPSRRYVAAAVRPSPCRNANPRRGPRHRGPGTVRRADLRGAAAALDHFLADGTIAPARRPCSS